MSLIQVYARNVQIHMSRMNLTSSQVAASLCVTPVTFSRIRNGRIRMIDPAILTGLKNLFNCSANDLLEAQPDVEYWQGGKT